MTESTQTNTSLFLTLEGVDGAGKSTHVQWAKQYLTDRGIAVCLTREPGGTAIGERLRDLLLTEPMHLETETLLMFAARNEHLRNVIEPALAAGQWVVCDRFTDATFAYQGAGRALGRDRINHLVQWVHPDFEPSRTWLFDVPLEVARQRLSDARVPDRFEREQADFFKRTREGYLQCVKASPERFLTVDGTQPIERIREVLAADLDALLSRVSKGGG
jgi:dTMP kinase|uniref:dTMP kinase n=1 Tax=Orrella sp. TaxID=1921583 RepID=UPI00404711A3